MGHPAKCFLLTSPFIEPAHVSARHGHPHFLFHSDLGPLPWVGCRGFRKFSAGERIGDIPFRMNRTDS